MQIKKGYNQKKKTVRRGGGDVNRITFAAKIKNGMENEFRKRLGLVWKDVTYYLDDNNISNFSVWKMADLLFVYGEAEDDY